MKEDLSEILLSASEYIYYTIVKLAISSIVGWHCLFWFAGKSIRYWKYVNGCRYFHINIYYVKQKEVVL